MDAIARWSGDKVFHAGDGIARAIATRRAFSSEVEAGSRKENASK
jgi:hypothetical protein